MANNVLTGVVQITAPNATATFNQVAEGARKTETALKNIAPAANTSSSAITLLANNIKGSTSQFHIIGEAGQLAGSKLGSLSGVLQTTASTIPAVTQAAGGLGSSLLNLGKSIISSQLGVAALIGGVVALAESLFSGSSSFRDIDVAAAEFEGTLKRLKVELADFESQLDFSDKIQNIKNQLKGLSGTSLKLATAGDTGISDAKVIGSIDNQVAGLRKLQTELIKTRIESEKDLSIVPGVSGSLLGKLLLKGVKVDDINSTLLKQLDEDDQAIVHKYQETNTRIQELLEKRKSKSNDITIQANTQLLDIYNQQNEDEKKALADQKALHDKSAADYARYVSETIAQAKKLSAAFKDSISLKLNIGALDTKQDEFKKSLSFLQDFGDNNFKFTFTPAIDIKNIEFPPADVLPVATEFGTMFSKELGEYFKNNNPVDFSLIAAVNESKQPKFNFKGLEGLSKEQDKIVKQTAELTSIIAQPFDAMVDAIGRGENAFKAFGEGVKGILIGVIKKLVETAILAAALSVIFPGGIGGAKGFGAIFGKLFGLGGTRAQGGNVGGGQEYLVGENGPEIFRPNTGGRIIPNNQIGTGSSRQQGGLMVQVAGSTTVKGQDLLIAFTLANQSKLRLQ